MTYVSGAVNADLSGVSYGELLKLTVIRVQSRAEFRGLDH
jgi:hypothetical protein